MTEWSGETIVEVLAGSRRALPGWSTNPDDYEVVDGQLREINQKPPAEGVAMPPAAQAPPAETAPKGAVKRDYGVYQELVLDLANPTKIVEALQKVSVDGDAPVVVLARVGVGTGTSPKNGLTAVAQDVELDGDYDVIAAASVTSFKGVKTKQQRALVIN